MAPPEFFNGLLDSPPMRACRRIAFLLLAVAAGAPPAAAAPAPPQATAVPLLGQEAPDEPHEPDEDGPDLVPSAVPS